MSTHNVDINVNANTEQAQKSLSYLQSLMGEFGKQATNRMAGMLGAAAVAKMAFDKVSEAISHNIQTAKQVSQMAIKFNIDPSAMHSITMAAKDAGVNVRALTMSMKQLGKTAEKAISSKDLQKDFEQLGISAERLAEIQAKPSKFLPEIAKSLMEIGDENQRSAAGAALLGRQYQQLLPLIEELGTSEEARQKFLENENAMTEEQIAAHKEVAKIQNDLGDGFEKLVASVAPLLSWAMNFVSLLAEGLGYIKDMIWETKEAKEERLAGNAAKVGEKLTRWSESLKIRAETGNLSEDERSGIESAGGVEQFIAAQMEALKERSEAEKKVKDVYDGTWFDILNKTERKLVDKQLERKKAAAPVSESLEKALGVHESQAVRGDDYAVDGPDGTTRPSEEQAERIKRYEESREQLLDAAGEGALSKITKSGIKTATQDLRARKAEAEANKLNKDMAKYVRIQHQTAAIQGKVYDEGSDSILSKAAYKQLMEERGEGEKAEENVRTFESEGARRKAEKEQKAADRQLKASERKLYVGDPTNKQFKTNLTEVEKATDALEDAKDAQEGVLEDLKDANKDIAEKYEALQELNETEGQGTPEEEAKRARRVLELTTLITAEENKQKQLQAKANELKGQEIQAQENLRKAREKEFMQEVKRNDLVKERVKTERDFENSLKYKLMKVDGRSNREIEEQKIIDEQKKYEEMMAEYNKKMATFKRAESEDGAEVSDTEKSELENLTKAMASQKQSILGAAFDLGNKEAQGQVTDMRRIGGGGMEFGGLANTAREQLEVQRAMLKELEKKANLTFDVSGFQTDSGKYGRTYAQAVVLPDR